jgi:hypothetical protein
LPKIQKIENSKIQKIFNFTVSEFKNLNPNFSQISEIWPNFKNSENLKFGKSKIQKIIITLEQLNNCIALEHWNIHFNFL